VGGSSVDLPAAVGSSRRAEWPMQCERVGGAALLPVGRHHGDAPHLAAHVGQQGKSWGQNAVIVGHQDVHDRICVEPEGEPFTWMVRRSLLWAAEVLSRRGWP